MVTSPLRLSLVLWSHIFLVSLHRHFRNVTKKMLVLRMSTFHWRILFQVSFWLETWTSESYGILCPVSLVLMNSEKNVFRFTMKQRIHIHVESLIWMPVSGFKIFSEIRYLSIDIIVPTSDHTILQRLVRILI